MRWMFTAGLLVSTLLALPVLAAEALERPTAGVPVYRVSPGATGSVSGSAYSQQQDGQPFSGLPSGVYTRSSTFSGSSTVRQSGAIRQSIEYPNGMRVPQQSVQGSYQQQRDE
jgi:hypothetical protein